MPASTLHDFVLKLLSDASSREAFDTDPVAALRDAGLSDVSPEDVVDAIPLVLDFASATGSGEGLGIDSALDANGGLTGHSLVASGLGTGGFAFDLNDVTQYGIGGLDLPYGKGVLATGPNTDGGQSGEVGFESAFGGAEAKFGYGTNGVSGQVTDVVALGMGDQGLSGEVDGAFKFGVGQHGVSWEQDGRGGDMVTGTVAGVVTSGAGQFSDVLTEGAAALSGGIINGAGTADGRITDGAGQLSGAVQDPTSLHLPAVAPAAVPDLTAGLPEVPQLPGVPGVPDLGDLPVNLPHLPVDLPVDLPALPGLPAVPGLPEVPSLPNLPGADIVNGAVSDVTGHVPVVGDLTDGVLDNLPLGH